MLYGMVTIVLDDGTVGVFRIGQRYQMCPSVSKASFGSGWMHLGEWDDKTGEVRLDNRMWCPVGDVWSDKLEECMRAWKGLGHREGSIRRDGYWAAWMRRDRND